MKRTAITALLLCLSACAEEQDLYLQHHCEMVYLHATTGGELGWPDYNNTAHLCTTAPQPAGITGKDDNDEN
jgi:hypothetical protein